MCSWFGRMLYLSQVSGNLPIDVKRVNAVRRIRLVSISESYWLACKYSWILQQSTLSFVIGSISDRSAFKVWSPKPRKAISVSTHHDDLWSFAQLITRTVNEPMRTNQPVALDWRLLSSLIPFTRTAPHTKAMDYWSAYLSTSITFNTPITAYKK
jgi:hypothetical protein